MSIVANGVTPHAEYLGHRDDPPRWWRRPKQIRRRKKKPGPQPKGMSDGGSTYTVWNTLTD